MDPLTLMLAGSALGAGTGLLNQKAQKEKDYRDMMANAEMMRYSPWTMMKTGYMGATAPSTIGSLLQGGVAGAMQGQKFGGMFGGKPTGIETVKTIEAPANMSSWEMMKKQSMYDPMRVDYANV